MLPHDLPEWKYVQWCDDGTWGNINTALRRQLRVETGKAPDPAIGIIDSQSVKGTEVKGVRGFDGGKKVVGVKRHVVVDSRIIQNLNAALDEVRRSECRRVAKEEPEAARLIKGQRKAASLPEKLGRLHNSRTYGELRRSYFTNAT